MTLLVRKPRVRDAWQLPQGGIERGESLEDAAIRELREETGIVTGHILGRLRGVYEYTYPAGSARFSRYRGQHIEFVAALVPPSTIVAVDGKEIVDHHWASSDELGTYLSRRDYRLLAASLIEQANAMAARAGALADRARTKPGPG